MEEQVITPMPDTTVEETQIPVAEAYTPGGRVQPNEYDMGMKVADLSASINPDKTMSEEESLIESLDIMAGAEAFLNASFPEDVATPEQVMDLSVSMYKPDMRPTTNNVDQMEKIEEDAAYDKYYKSQENLKQTVKAYSGLQNNLSRLPKEEQEYILSEIADGSRSVPEVIKEMQNYIGTKNDGILGDKTVKAFSTNKPLPSKGQFINYKDKVGGKEDKASNYLIEDEGYSDKLPANVPSSKSGITIGGLDLANGGPKIDRILRSELPKDVVDSLMKVKNLKGDDAKAALSNITISLTNEQLQSMQDKYINTKVAPALQEYIGKDYRSKLPKEVSARLEALSFLNTGPISLNSIDVALKSGKKSDWKKVVANYENYWNSQSQHNRNRSDRVAEAIKKWKDI